MRIRRQNERGFALLLVFAMAAAAAVMLYLEMPRVAFEHQRGKEALLVDRGEQYVRAIQMYQKKFNKLPQTLDDLDSSGNQRFLRRRYKDPMTGEDEWRLVHTDASGQYMDSKVHKRQDQKEKSGPSILSSNIVGIGESAQYIPQAGDKQSAAQQRRASDRIIPAGSGGGNLAIEGGPPTDPNAPQQGGPQQPGAPLLGGPAPAGPQQPGAPLLGGSAPAQQQVPSGGNPFQLPSTQQSGSQSQSTFPTQGVNSQTGGMIGQPTNPSGTQSSGQAGSSGSFGFSTGFGNNASSQSGSRSGTGFGQTGGSQSSGGFGQSSFGQTGQSGQSQGGFGQSSFGQTGFGSNSGSSNSPLGAIQNALTNTRPGGMPTGVGGLSGTTGLGAGIVGVASKKEAEGILVYKERTNYSEWEFLFDPKANAVGAQGQGAMGQGQQGQGQNRGTNSTGFGGMGSSGSSGFGGMGSSGSSGFGGMGSSGSSGFGGFGGSSGSSSGSGFGFGGSSGTQPRPAPGGFGRQ